MVHEIGESAGSRVETSLMCETGTKKLLPSRENADKKAESGTGVDFLISSATQKG
jgi:hypothetical protein